MQTSRVSNESLVKSALAAHLEVAADELTVGQRLADDLGLDPLDLVLIALRLEENAGVEFPIARLEDVRTVGDLAALVTTWHDDTRPTSPAFYSPLSFDTASEAFFARPLPDLEPATWPVDDEDDVRALTAEHRRRACRPWVAVLLAGSLTLLAAAWLPLIGG